MQFLLFDIERFFYSGSDIKLAVQGQGKEGNVSTSCECCGIDMYIHDMYIHDMYIHYIHDMYLSSNVTQWNVANCMVFSIPPSPICSVKSSCSKGELK